MFVGDLAEPGNFDIYTIRPDGSGLRRLTKSPAFDADAHFSPDGKSIVFGSDRTGNADVFVMRRNGSGVRRITRHPSFDAYPVFSDNGRSIAFVSERDGERERRLQDASGRDTRAEPDQLARRAGVRAGLAAVT